LEGASVCFTGEMSLPRPELSNRAVNAGLIVKSGISKKLDVLVVADADSMSGKAKKARELGIRIVSESVFLVMLGELPSA
jgi:DNA polymerase-3 subunit epsilon